VEAHGACSQRTIAEVGKDGRAQDRPYDGIVLIICERSTGGVLILTKGKHLSRIRLTPAPRNPVKQLTALLGRYYWFYRGIT